MKIVTVMLATSIFFASCSDTKSDNSAVEKSTTVSSTQVTSKELNEGFDKAWNSRDTAKLYSLIADDIQMLDGTVHLNGKQEVIEKFIRKDLPVTSNLKTSVVSSGESNTLAYEAGTFQLDVTLPNNPVFVTKGNYNFVWKNEADNVWKITSINMEDLPSKK